MSGRSSQVPDGMLPTFVVGPGGCWIWTRAQNYGYGRWGKRDADQYRRAHVVIWETFNGPVPDGLELDHLCRVRCCVNPAHLEAVTHRENVARGESPSASLMKQTHCKHGHLLSGDNLYLAPGRNGNYSRICRECRKKKAKGADRG